MRQQRHPVENLPACPVEVALDLMGGKWKAAILFRLSEGKKRFNEMGRLMCKITPRTLTKQLRQLEADGLIHRKVYAVVPPKVEYSLMHKGRTFLPALLALKAWGEMHLNTLQTDAPRPDVAE